VRASSRWLLAALLAGAGSLHVLRPEPFDSIVPSVVAVFPANVALAFHPGDVPRWLAIARLPLQVPLVLWALQVRRAAARP
jgi:uncharacterized membrane protein